MSPMEDIIAGKKVFVYKETNNDLPKYSTPYSAGMDLRANLDKDVILQSGETKLIDTGICVRIPNGYKIQITPRSGIALKHSVTVLNAPGIIDSDFKSKIGVILINHGKEPFTIKNGDRIAQMILTKYERIEWEEIIDLSEFIDKFDLSSRDGGFGSTGIS